MDEKTAIEILQTYNHDDRDGRDAFEIAIETLEKQIPKSPIADDNGGYPEYFERWLECPDCGEIIPEYVEENETECYCLKCGQKLAWQKE